MKIVAGIVIISFAAWFAWKCLSPQPAIKLVISPDGLLKIRGFSQHAEKSLRRFLRDDVALESSVTIVGFKDQHGKLRFTFRGDIDPGTEQQIRNFLHTVV